MVEAKQISWHHLKGIKAKSKSLGIEAKIIGEREPYYSHQGNQAFIPASNMKLALLFGALGRVNWDTPITLNIYVDGDIHQGTLKGNLYIQGGFSDFFSIRYPRSANRELLEKRLDQRVAILIEKLKAHGIHQVDGHVWPFNKEEYEFYYSPYPSAHPYLFWDNTIDLWINDGKAYSVPKTLYSFSLSPEEAGPAQEKGSLRSERDRISYNTSLNSQDYWRLDESPPGDYYFHHLKLRLNEKGFPLKEQDYSPGRARKLMTLEGEPLRAWLEPILSHSDNLKSEVLFLILSSFKNGLPEPERSSEWVEKKYFKEGFTECRIKDGSGLSSQNLLSPRSLIYTLENLQGEVSKEYFASPGKKGTLFHKLKPFKGKLWAKTGTLENHRALSGYFEKENKKVCFSILFNQLSKEGEKFYWYNLEVILKDLFQMVK